ncbi:hypothetical protein [Brassicibacter mesophilus]|uniref:hypothetical protein n=1 Tax=Brassicibacter mesophilus TaxID=745119 RepID=UPI003D21F939
MSNYKGDIKFDIHELRKWQQEGNRTVGITLGDLDDKEKMSVWCYDYELGAGQHIVESVSELNLINKKIEMLEIELERYKQLKEVI